MKLYAWQQECLKAWEENGCRGIVNVVTGAGKTVLALEAIRRFRKKHENARIRIVVPTIPLAQQWQSALLQEAESEADRPGFFGAGRRDSQDRPLMIYIINSARDHLAGHMEQAFALGQPVLLVCDECHHYQSRENRRIFDFRIPRFFSPEQYACLGLSATPFETAHDEVLHKELGEEIYRYGFAEASAAGIVSQFTVMETAASFLPEERRIYQELSRELIMLWSRLLRRYPYLKGMEEKAFLKELNRLAREAGMDPSNPAVSFLLKTWERKKVSNLALTRIQCAYSILKQLPEDARAILFCERIVQARDLQALLRRKMGNIAVLYHSEMSREARSRSLQAFREKQVRVLICCRALDEGVDVPDAGVGIVLSSSSVSRQRIQRLGRILRKAPGKTAACLYYIYLPESTDDCVYLPGLQGFPRAGLRYDAEEDAFSNELYEYAARDLLREAESLTPAQRQELRRCLLEGLARADYLLPPDAFRAAKEETVHERNYRKTMKKMSLLFHRDAAVKI